MCCACSDQRACVVMVDISICGLRVIRELKWLSDMKSGTETCLRELTQHSNIGEAWRELAKSVGKVLRDDPVNAADSMRSYVALRYVSCANGRFGCHTEDRRICSIVVEDAAGLLSATAKWTIPWFSCSCCTHTAGGLWWSCNVNSQGALKIGVQPQQCRSGRRSERRVVTRGCV